MASSTIDSTELDRPTGTFMRSRSGWDGRHWAVIGLVAVTGLIHLYLGVLADPAFAPAFYAAGIGWFLGAAVFFTSYWRRWMYLVAAVYAVAQIGLWILSGFQFPAIGMVDKVVELAILALVIVLYREG